jgi:hypothetical protein
MNGKRLITNAILWPAAIIAAALVGAPSVLSVILLPTLAVASLLLVGPKHRATTCGARMGL